MNYIEKYQWYIVGLLTSLFLVFGCYKIGEQALVDEPLWAFKRIEAYWHGIKDGNLTDTRVSNKPGVTVSIVASPGLTFHTRPSMIKESISPADRQELLTRMRLPIVLFLSALLPLFFYFSRHLFGLRNALAAYMFVTLSPLLIGMSRILNPDALLWLSLPLSLLSFLMLLDVFYEDEFIFTKRVKKLVVVSGLLFGFCLLTKYVSTLFFVYFPISILLFAVFKHQSVDETSLTLRKLFGLFSVVSLIAFSALILLLPSIWVRPVDFLQATFTSQAFEPIWKPFLSLSLILLADLFLLQQSLVAILLTRISRFSVYITRGMILLWGVCLAVVVASTFAGLSLHDSFTEALRSPKDAGKNVGYLAVFFADFYILLFGLSILGGLTFLFGLFSLWKDSYKRNASDLWIYTVILAFPLVYYAGSTISGVTTILRYQIALYPLIFLVCAYGLNRMFSCLPTRQLVFAWSVVLFGTLATLVNAYPYYFSFVSPALPQSDLLNIKDMGDGSYQAAAYLNTLPNAESLVVWSDKAGVCDVFVGTCETTVNVEKIAEAGLEFDYYVVSRGRKHLTERNASFKRRSSKAPDETYHFDQMYRDGVAVEFEILPSGRKANYIRVLNASKVDIFYQNDERK